MKKFKFTMQTLLNVKRTLEKQQTGDLAECNARLLSAEKTHEELLDNRIQKNRLYEKMITEGLTAHDLRLWRNSFEAIKEQIARSADLIIQIEKERDEKQNILLETMRERKMLENLREKQLEEYGVEQRREDAAMIDEFLSNTIFEGGGELGTGS